MIEGYIYLLKVALLSSPSDYENQFKLGCTGNPDTRYPSYSTSYGAREYTMDLIQIIEVPYIIRKRFHEIIKEERNCDYAEAYLHSKYNDYIVTNPSSKQNTEFFIPESFKIPSIDEIYDILCKAGFKCKICDTLDKDTFSALPKDHDYKNIPKKDRESGKKQIKKTLFKIDEHEEIILKDKYI